MAQHSYARRFLKQPVISSLEYKDFFCQVELEKRLRDNEIQVLNLEEEGVPLLTQE